MFNCSAKNNAMPSVCCRNAAVLYVQLLSSYAVEQHLNISVKEGALNTLHPTEDSKLLVCPTYLLCVHEYAKLI